MSNAEIKTDTHDVAVEEDAGATPQDLRDGLKVNLESEFQNNLIAGALSDTSQESLMEILGDESLTSADILKALALEDPVSSEVLGE